MQSVEGIRGIFAVHVLKNLLTTGVKMLPVSEIVPLSIDEET